MRLLALALLLAGCGGDVDSNTDAGGGPYVEPCGLKEVYRAHGYADRCNRWRAAEGTCMLATTRESCEEGACRVEACECLDEVVTDPAVPVYADGLITVDPTYCDAERRGQLYDPRDP